MIKAQPLRKEMLSFLLEEIVKRFGIDGEDGKYKHRAWGLEEAVALPHFFM